MAETEADAEAVAVAVAAAAAAVVDGADDAATDVRAGAVSGGRGVLEHADHPSSDRPAVASSKPNVFTKHFWHRLTTPVI